MTPAVPRVPYPDRPIADFPGLYRFLRDCQSRLAGNGTSPVISFCQKISPVDLLEILGVISLSSPTVYYWENRREETAVLGYGNALSATFPSYQRFSKARQFIETSQKKILKIDRYSDITPRVFCSFTFFDSDLSSPFPPATIALPKFQIVQRRADYYLLANLPLSADLAIEPSIEEITEQLQLLQKHPRNVLRFPRAYRERESRDYRIHPTYDFQAAVTDALRSIEARRFSKLVLANALDVISPVPFDIVTCLDNLRERYPDCSVFAVSDGRGHHFIGASPERLLSVRDGQLSTDALAGSAPRGRNPIEDDALAGKLLASEKERREHQAVSDFIAGKLSELGLNPRLSPFRLLKLSNIQHLWTPIHATLPDAIHPLEIIARLHPTPAVAGVPTEIALAEIRQYETFERSLYAAPFGWIDGRGNSEFIVGIRSALIEGDRARLYAGAGIVAGSDPERELAEIQLKFQALLNALL
ncbi:isochorismate synthase [Pannus brasiliensis CCIBt3594]|uniref:isochorismate synthase n=1 Tax=Pannus brasiliensis CCIBt3594 TaxID=1427578 RepID=A0AAW9QUN6_9CHRO